MKPCYLFVYGTLRSDCGAAQADLIGQQFRLVALGSVQGLIYEIDGYPGLVLSANTDDAVKGELYELTGAPEVILQLDGYEGCSPEYPGPHEYRRREVPIKLQGGGDVLAWVYVYNWPLQGRKPLLSGDYAVRDSDGGPK